jgi:hypothetical protein
MMPLAVHELQKVELLLAGQRVRRAHVFARVGGATVHVKRNALHGFAGSYGLDLACNFRPASLELGSELGRDCVRAVLIRLLEGAANRAIYRRRNDGDAEQHRGRKQQKKLFAKTHCEPASSCGP